MNNQENINIVKRFVEEVYNKNNTNTMDELTSSSLTIHDPALHNQKEGLRGYKELENQFKRAFPDKRTKIEDIFSSDDKVLVRWSTQAKHKGDLKDIPATNKDIKISGMTLYMLKNGKIVEIFQQWDRLGLLEQIGEVQPAAALH